MPQPLLADLRPHVMARPYFVGAGRRWVTYVGDCRRTLSLLPAGSVDLVLADPPYFLSNGGTTCQAGRRVKVDKGDWDAARTAVDMHAFNLSWLRACQRVLRTDGTIAVCGTRHNIHSVGFALQVLGFRLLNELVWEKPNPPPNLGCRCFTDSAETIIWAARSAASRHTFDYASMRVENGGRQMKTVWRVAPARGPETARGRHPAQKPVALLSRLIRATTRPDDLIVDPFAGSCSSGISAAQLGRRWLGIDTASHWLEVGTARYRDLTLAVAPGFVHDGPSTGGNI